MEKNARLADIYIKIYNKRPLTLDDLSFLAKFDRECFEKTCQNVVYNMPEAKKLMRQEPARLQEEPARTAAFDGPSEAEESGRKEAGQDIGALLENLKKMEWQNVPVADLDAENVKNLLGSLYMEMLFPHNDRYRYFQLEEDGDESVFNKKA